MMLELATAGVFVFLINTVFALDNGVGLYPAMGWVSWSAFGVI